MPKSAEPCYEVASRLISDRTRVRRDGNPADHLVYKNSRPAQPAPNRAPKTSQIEKLPRVEKRYLEILPRLARYTRRPRPPGMAVLAACTQGGGEHLFYERLGQGWGPLTL